jgi:hypothetical protein
MNSFPLTGLLCPLFFVAFVVLAIVAIIRLASKSGSSGSGGFGRPPVDVPTQLEQDGFWMISCPADPGSIIYYHYWTGGTRYSGQVPFKPEADGRQFVYTGRRPDQVSITRIVTVDDDSLIPPVMAAGSMWDPPDIPSVSSTPPSAPSPSSFPSAY